MEVVYCSCRNPFALPLVAFQLVRVGVGIEEPVLLLGLRPRARMAPPQQFRAFGTAPMFLGCTLAFTAPAASLISNFVRIAVLAPDWSPGGLLVARTAQTALCPPGRRLLVVEYHDSYTDAFACLRVCLAVRM